MSRRSSMPFLELCHDIVVKCRDRVLLNLSCNCHDMSVLCRDISLVPCSFNTQMVCRNIKTLLQQSFLLATLDCVAT